MNECEKIQSLISCLIDGELTDAEKCEVEKHIATCPQCAAMYEDFSALSGTMADTMVEVPAALHDSIMKGVKAAAVPVKKKKRPVIALRPYMSAAACLVVVVGAVLAFRNGSFEAANSSSAADTAGLASIPASYSATSEPAEAPAESVEAPMDSADYSAGIPADDYSYGTTAEAEPESNLTTEDGVAGRYTFVPGNTVDKAVLTLLMSDGSEQVRELTELDKLSEALIPINFTESYGSEFIPSAVLEIQSEGRTFVLELGFAGEALIVRQSGEYYFASATPQEFLEIK